MRNMRKIIYYFDWPPIYQIKSVLSGFEKLDARLCIYRKNGK
ncbi:hypothetical protein LEP1GSC016_3468 [Leptospira borgpetersenii serovar Hardjo-bovis str. Sponselee]|uniref:Uncharacterized protein n=1 Tax=Leptospira borgpetersenii serovar Hardjo-bovis str. Sponselee TaxID=1303729 RepID=M6BTX5_LEPBO|nr:hypothetical protein LEP1GSC016_3468 [Leptospira borgpetersenii serovar Hardjo-bovis str. Sponselee]